MKVGDEHLSMAAELTITRALNPKKKETIPDHDWSAVARQALALVKEEALRAEREACFNGTHCSHLV